MKINQFVLKIIVKSIEVTIKKRRKTYPNHDFKEFLNVSYIDTPGFYHHYDVYLVDNPEDYFIIDIHGGAYLLGESRDNYPYVYHFLKANYPSICIDYEPTKGKRDIADLFLDVVNAYNHILSHLKDYNLENKKIILMGDSAGGHLALLLLLVYQNVELQEKMGIKLLDSDIKMLVLASPVYDYASIAKMDMMNDSAKAYMMGPRFKDEEHQKLYSPNTHISLLKDIPIYLSTCKNDFIRQETLHLKDDLESRNHQDFVFKDVSSDNKDVDHVHNVAKPYLKESKEVNDEIIEFIKKYS